MRIEVLPTAADVATAAAERLVAHAAAGHHIALSGGSTPKAAYQRAAGLLGDWRNAVLWFGDDRAVGPEHEHSNFAMTRQALLAGIPGDRRPRVERILGERGADAAAEEYEARRATAPPLHLALMGLGPDGHTASLFPGKPAVDERERQVVAVPEAGMEPYVPRVTLTLPVFEAAGEVLFLVAGADKREAMERAFGTDPDPDSPAARLRPPGLVVLCDEAAAPEGAAIRSPG